MGKNENTCDCNMVHGETIEHVRQEIVSQDELTRMAKLYKIFGDGTRLNILAALNCHEMCVCDLAALLGVTKSAVSHQLKALRLANLVRFRREGQIVYYMLADDHVKRILDIGFEHLREE